MEHDNIQDMFTENNDFRGMILVLDGLMGGGKTTMARLLTQTEKHINFSVSATTREKRENEVNGLNYHFMSKEEFKEKEESGFFLETTNRAGNLYGTPKKAVTDALSHGEDIIFDIDYVGTRALKEEFPDDVIRVFLLPPSYKELEKRLKERASETPEQLKERMKSNAEYLKLWEEYDYIFVNDSVQNTLRRLQQILRAERLKRHRQPWLDKFINDFRDDLESDL